KYPASHSPADLAATLRAEAYMNRQYLDPVFRGTHAEELVEVFGEAWPALRPAEQMAVIREPIDWLGINYYTRSVVRADESAWPQRASAVPQRGALHTETAWEVYPRGLTDTLTWVKNRYGDLPIYVTENGSAFFDPPSAEVDPLPDPLRTQTLHKHLAAVHAAIGAGVDVRGYYAWSLLDNLEWAHGYSKRFGLLHVDYATQRRTPKASALAYAAVIAANAL
ncbi:MAG: family 1 glycosylhydrolase, partial [Burkholderiales bacterium]|nr:family 1 glycosylhydrolase [Burkholderiales bacterium]